MGALAALVTTCAIWACTKPLIVGVWLSQLQEFEADEIGAAISKKAGCSPTDITTAMAALCVREASFRRGALGGGRTDARIQTSLTALQQLLPNSQLPMQPVQDSRGLQLVLDAATDELSTASDGVHTAVDQEVKQLRRLIGRKCFEHRDPLRELKSSHPHGLDRIARVQSKEQTSQQTSEASALGSLQLPEREAWLQMPWSRSPGQNTQRLLTIFQTSPTWPGVLAYLQIHNLWAFEEFKLACSARKVHSYSYLLMVKEDAVMEYDAASKMAAVGLAVEEDVSWYVSKAQKALRHNLGGTGIKKFAGQGEFSA